MQFFCEMPKASTSNVAALDAIYHDEACTGMRKARNEGGIAHLQALCGSLVDELLVDVIKDGFVTLMMEFVIAIPKE